MRQSRGLVWECMSPYQVSFLAGEEAGVKAGGRFLPQTGSFLMGFWFKKTVHMFHDMQDWSFIIFLPSLDTSHHSRPVANRPCYTFLHCGQDRRLVLSRTESPRFHCQTKGKNIRLDTHGRKAIRRNSFCNGITFTSRPIHLYEKVRLKLVSVHHGWSGALRFGFTIHDPAQMKTEDIPKYACPDLVTRPGYWAKALPERFAQRDNILAFWVDRHGRIFYSINDEEPILFHCGVKVSSPLWALIDVYGITQEVQILGTISFFVFICILFKG